VKAVLKIAAPWIIAVLTVVVVVSNFRVDPTVWDTYATDLFLCAVITALSVYFSVLLTETELSISHAAGMLYFVSLEGRVLPAMTLAVCAGAIVGAGASMLRGRLRPLNPTFAGAPRNYVLLVARVVLSFWVAARVYLAANGTLPLRDMDTILSMWWQVAVYAAVYIALYLLLLVLETFASNLHLLRADIPRVVVVMLLPLPLVIMGTEIRSQLGTASMMLYALGLVFIVISMHGLSLSEFRLRRRLQESRTYSMLSQVVQMKLDQDSLLRALYAQASHVLESDNFTAALVDASGGDLRYALVMRHGTDQTELLAAAVPPDSLTGHVARSGQPLLVASAVSERARALHLAPTDDDVVSWVGVPMAAGGRVVGVLAAQSRDPRHLFTQTDVNVLSSIAASGSIAIENARLYQQQRERAEQLAVLNRMASLISANLGFDQVADSVMTAARTISRADAAALYLYTDDAKAALPMHRSEGFSASALRDPLESLWAQQTKPQTGPLVIEDLASSDRDQAEYGALDIESIQSLIELPLVAAGRPLGVLALYFRVPQQYGDDTLDLLKTFSAQAAQALTNARTYSSTDAALQRSAEQLSALAEIGRLLTSTLQLNEIGRLILDYAAAATQATGGLIALLDDKMSNAPGTMTIAASRGAARSPRRLTLPDHPLYLRALQTQEMQHVDRLTRSVPYSPVNPQAASALLLPLMRGQEAIGVLALEIGQGAGFSPEDIDYARQLASSAVIALDNARLFASIAQDRDRLRVLLNTMEEGMIVINPAGIITMANPRVDLIGLEPSDIAGQPFMTLIVDPRLGLAQRLGFGSVDEARGLISTMNETAAVAPVSYDFRGDRGALYLRRAAVPIHDQEGRISGLLLVIYNKTEEQELTRSREDLTRMLVHDLRSPMTAVTTSLKLIGELTPRENQHYGMIMDAVSASRRAVKKILYRLDALLDIARMDRGQVDLEPGIVALSNVVENVFADLRPLAQEVEVQLVNTLSPDAPPVSVDADKIERVLMNLVDNALKYTPADGVITVRARTLDSKHMQVEVIDTGPGIPDDYKQRLFDQFVQIEGRAKVRRGVGLGLTFCRLVIAAHGGRIWIEDNPEGGSVFAFTLPLVPAEVFEDD
jgi:signal transduction histidine kinase